MNHNLFSQLILYGNKTGLSVTHEPVCIVLVNLLPNTFNPSVK